MKDPAKLKLLVLEKIKLADLMLAYKVSFAFSPKHADAVQFKCPFHGKDNKPSARLYNTTNTAWCWVCRKAWDPISFIMDKEKMSFMQALRYLIDRFKIDTSSILDQPTIEFKPITISETRVSMKHLHNSILGLRKKIPLEKYSALCGVYCMIEYRESTGKDIIESVKKLEGKIACLQGL
jgi:hypothetical protein